MKRIRLNFWLTIILVLFLIPLACRLSGRQETTPVPVLPVTASETPSVPMDETPTDSVVSGGILIEDGRSATGGYAGDTIQISVTFTATSRVAVVTEMRTSGSCSAEALQEAAWEPFVGEKTFPVQVMMNWFGLVFSVQYRDAQGNLSPVYCDDINMEGMPRPPTAP